MSELEKISAKISNILAAKAVVLAGEPAWEAEDAFQVAAELAYESCIILGVELWLNENGKPKWIATSGYSYDNVAASSERIRLSCEAARDFVRWGEAYIEHNDNSKRPLYNLTWEADTD